MNKSDVGFVVCLIVCVVLFSGITIECDGKRYSIVPMEKGCCR